MASNEVKRKSPKKSEIEAEPVPKPKSASTLHHGFRFDLLKTIARSHNINTRKINGDELYHELQDKGLIPELKPLTKECGDKSLGRLVFQAKLLNIPTEGYREDTKQLLCDEIDKKLRKSGEPDVFAGINELEREQMCEIVNERGEREVVDTKMLVAKAKQYGIPVNNDLDKSALCFVIKKELDRLRAGGRRKEAIQSKMYSKPVVSTYDKFVIDPEIEEKLNVTELSRVISNFPLRPAQLVPAEWLAEPDHFGLTLFHEVGTGKTFSAINTSQVLLRKGVIDNVIIITPKSLMFNFKDQFTKFNKDLATDTRYQFFTPTAFQNLLSKKKSSFQCLPNTLLIIDEAHNYRTHIWDEKRKSRKSDSRSMVIEDNILEDLVADDQGEEVKESADKGNYYDINVNYSGKQARSIYYFLHRCRGNVNKVLLLTATPFVNHLYDLENLMCFMKMGSIAPRPKKDVAKMDDYPNDCLFHFHQTSEEYKKEYPRVTYHSEYYRMSDEYYESYYKIQRDQLDRVGEAALYKAGSLQNFFNGVRRASNVGPDLEYSDKLKAVISMVREDVKKNPNIRILIYSSWLGTGIQVLEDVFKGSNIRSATITGKLTTFFRKKIVDEYNNLASGLNVLLISKAGGEGLDLKRTRKVYILEPTWNDASIQQIIGRAVRFKSHQDLPVEEQTVDIYRLFLLKPFEAELLARDDPRVEQMLNDYAVLGKYPKDFFNGIANTEITYVDKEQQQRTETDLVMSIDLYLYKFLRKKQTQLDTYIDELENRSETCFDELEYRIDEKIEAFRKKYKEPLGKHIEPDNSRVKLYAPRNDLISGSASDLVQKIIRPVPSMQIEDEDSMIEEREEAIQREIEELVGLPRYLYRCLKVDRLDYVPNYESDVKPVKVIKIGEGEEEWSIDSVQKIVPENNELRQLAEDGINIKLFVMYRVPLVSTDKDEYILFNIYYKDPLDSRKLKRYGRIYKK